jgi:cell volume regulation protein A
MNSIDLVNSVILVGSLLVMMGIISSLVATRFGAPLLFVFLIVGMLAGEDGPGGIQFNDYRATYLVGSLALSVILFDGGLRTKLATFRAAVAPSLTLATLGVVVTAAVTGTAAFYVLDLTPIEALLLGSIVASTDAAAVFFLLRTGGLQLQTKVGSVLEVESGTNDPLAVFLTIVLTEAVLAGGEPSALAMLGRLAAQGAIGAALGVAGGFALVALLNRVPMPGGLHPLFVVASAVMIYSGTSLLGGSGLLAVYLAGLVIANRPVRAYPSIVGFHDAATWLCQIVMFLVLGLLVTPTTLIDYALPGLAVALVLTFVARPVAVWLCLSPFGFDAREKLFVSWVGLRGAVSIFLAAIPTLAGVPNAATYFNIAFFVVLLSLLIQGWTITGVARRLGRALRRTAPSVYRVEVDIPGQTDQELIGYPVAADSLILALSKLPAWARLVLVVRGGEILAPPEAGTLQAGDYVYLLAAPARIPRLDRLFGESPEMARRNEPLFGELPFNADARVSAISALYDLELPPEERELTVADYFARHLRTPPQPGSRVPIGGATLVARSVEEGRVARAGLQIAELMDALVASARRRRGGRKPRPPIERVGPRLQRLAARLRRVLRRGPAAAE